MPLAARTRETFGSFRQRDFSLVWISANIAMAGRQMEVIAVLWLVLELTDSAVLVGMAGAAPLSLAFLSVFAGAVVDRMPRRLLLATMQFIAAALAFLLMWLLLLDALRVWMIFVIIIGGGVFRTFELPVTNALLIDTVPRARLTNAVAMLGLGQNLTQFVGPIVAGFLFTPLTPGGLFAFIGAFYAIGGLLALLVRTRNPSDAASPGHGGKSQFLSLMVAMVTYLIGGIVLLLAIAIFAKPQNRKDGGTTAWTVLLEMAYGLRHVWQRKELFMALLIAAFYNVTGFPFTTALMPIFARETLQSGPETLGLLNGAMGLGAVFGALLVAGLGDFRRQGWWLVWAVNGGWHLSMILFAVATLTLPGLLPFTAVLAIALAVKVWTGIGRAGSLVLVMTVLMGNSDPEYRGRMGGMRVLAIQAHFPASVLNGWLVTQVGAPLTALYLGVGGAVAVFLCLLSRRLREA